MATLRPAVPADAPALARLRSLMHEAMGADPAATRDPLYVEAVEQAFVRRLTGDPGFATYVVEQDGAVVACGVAHVEHHLPSPGRLDGRRGHVSCMSTDPAARRQGHARAVLGALLSWLDGQGIARTDLRATPDGQPLYAAAGFAPLHGVTMSRTR